ncbi:MAG: excisionase family DNA-binding protein [Terriglobales bacterium]|jgi:excisionase family DNA binding protein
MASKEKEISAIEAARRLGVGLDYLYSLLWTGKLLGRKVGKQWRIPAEAVQARRKERGA